jgi:E217 collar protein gp28
MSIPGGNLLKVALGIIAKQTVSYYQFISRAASAKGQWVATYADPVNLVGSFQPVPRKLYEQYGLDFSKSYFTFYTSNNILSTQRDVSGDQLAFNGVRYQCESNNDWFPIDGWKGVLCVQTVSA